mmetsp:Transcript_5225/g.16805  ORF Transcript_5225/g.16805 Transcript_5225/m.16805 type:complete len:245 (-) Transcript_5225:23-757(-)
MHHHAHATDAASRVVQGQHAENAVRGPDAKHYRKHASHGKEANVRQRGRLGEAGGAARVHQEGGIERLDTLARAGGDGGVVHRRQNLVQRGGEVHSTSLAVQGHASRHRRQHSSQLIFTLDAEQHKLAPGHAQRVLQRLGAQVVVDQSRDDADFGSSEPHDHVLGPVLHHQRDHVTASKTLGLEPPRHLVAAVLDICERPPMLLILQRRLLRPTAIGVCEHIRDRRVGSKRGVHREFRPPEVDK